MATQDAARKTTTDGKGPVRRTPAGEALAPKSPVDNPTPGPSTPVFSLRRAMDLAYVVDDMINEICYLSGMDPDEVEAILPRMNTRAEVVGPWETKEWGLAMEGLSAVIPRLAVQIEDKKYGEGWHNNEYEYHLEDVPGMASEDPHILTSWAIKKRHRGYGTATYYVACAHDSPDDLGEDLRIEEVIPVHVVKIPKGWESHLEYEFLRLVGIV